MTLKDKGRSRKSNRKTRYGFPLGGKKTNSVPKTSEGTSSVIGAAGGTGATGSKGNYQVPASPPAVTTSYPAKPLKTYKPISEEVDAIGQKMYRTPSYEGEFRGFGGTKQEAIILDIDGTLTTHGQSFDKRTLDWCEKHYKANGDIVFIVLTARDHEYMYESSFNTLMRGFPYAFIGPFCRAKDDPRYATEFKRSVAESLSAIFDIIGAADDNPYVLKMWDHWATEWFEEPKDFDILRCKYATYKQWRSDLPSKGHSTYVAPAKSTTTAYTPPTVDSKGRKYIKGGSVDGKWVSGHYEGQIWQAAGTNPKTGNWQSAMWVDPPEDETKDEAKHRPAGTSRWEDTDLTKEPCWANYLAERYGAHHNKPGSWPGGHLNVISESPNEEDYEEATDALDEVIAANATGLTREDMEAIVAHDCPGMDAGEIQAMSMRDLREYSGITCDDYRESLYEAITTLHGTWWTDEELDEVDIETVESFLSMEREDVNEILDELHDARQTAAAEAEAEANFDPEIQAREARLQARMDLEDDVMASYEELTVMQVMSMDTDILERMRDEALARRLPDPYQGDLISLDVAEALAEIGEQAFSEGLAAVNAIVDVHLPPVGAQGSTQEVDA